MPGIITGKASPYRLKTDEVKQLIRELGGFEKAALELDLSIRALQRTLTNTSLNGRTQKAIAQYVGKELSKIATLEQPRRKAA